jgi:hypothetical protein
MSADQIGIALKGRRNGGGWLVRCPCPNHGKGRGDRFPSLSVADGNGGRLLLRCFAGCDFVEILDELKLRGLVDGIRSEPLHRFTPSVHRFVEPNPDVGALTIWQATVEAQETFVDEYLNCRHIYGAQKRGGRHIEAKRLAVFRSSTNSNLVACSIGRSASLAPSESCRRRDKNQNSFSVPYSDEKWNISMRSPMAGILRGT